MPGNHDTDPHHVCRGKLHRRTHVPQGEHPLAAEGEILFQLHYDARAVAHFPDSHFERKNDADGGTGLHVLHQWRRHALPLLTTMPPST